MEWEGGAMIYDEEECGACGRRGRVGRGRGKGCVMVGLGVWEPDGSGVRVEYAGSVRDSRWVTVEQGVGEWTECGGE